MGNISNIVIQFDALREISAENNNNNKLSTQPNRIYSTTRLMAAVFPFIENFSR